MWCGDLMRIYRAGKDVTKKVLVEFLKYVLRERSG